MPATLRNSCKQLLSLSLLSLQCKHSTTNVIMHKCFLSEKQIHFIEIFLDHVRFHLLSQGAFSLWYLEGNLLQKTNHFDDKTSSIKFHSLSKKCSPLWTQRSHFTPAQFIHQTLQNPDCLASLFLVTFHHS